MNLNNIPQELKEYAQWVCWKSVVLEEGKKPTKIPYNPSTGNKANVMNQNTFSSFEDAQSKLHLYTGIGFVLTDNDPYVFIDIDDPKGDPRLAELNNNVCGLFDDSYAELSPSGTGVHILVKGSVPAGKRQGSLEVYSNMRYMTVTGDVWRDFPIIETQSRLDQMYANMGWGVTKELKFESVPETANDQAIYDAASNASNSELFNSLWKGNYHGMYPSQSEADMALISILSFYTQNAEQIIRLFRSSALGKRDKAMRTDYVNTMVAKGIADHTIDCDISAITDQISKFFDKEEEKEQAPLPPKTNIDILESDINRSTTQMKRPPGLIGDLADFIFAASPRPVREISVAAAIGFMCGLAGRAYNISGTGLNQYILLLAPTGTGKEAMAIGIDRIIDNMAIYAPDLQDIIGPSDMASGQALSRYLAQGNDCFLSVTGEFGLKLQQMCHPRAGSSEIALRRIMLDLFNKSGKGQSVKPTIFADKDKNIEPVQSPAFSLLGESTGKRYYEAIDEGMIAEGLIPRFLTIEYTGNRPPTNEMHGQAQLPAETRIHIGKIWANVKMITEGNEPYEIPQNDEAREFLRKIDKYCDYQINNSDKEVINEIWNRGHLKTLKLAAIAAVGQGTDPVIGMHEATWAWSIVEQDALKVIAKFESGKVGRGSDEARQMEGISVALSRFFKSTYSEVKSHVKCKKMHEDGIIPRSYIQARNLNRDCFKKDRSGASNALTRMLKVMVDNGDLKEVPNVKLNTEYGFNGKCYQVMNPLILKRMERE